jgi:glyoxylase-like metal-dependent hydrolase (beta-lactamase superfamily II)
MGHVPSRTRKKVESLLRRAEGLLLPDRLLASEGTHLEPGEARRALHESGEDVARLGVGQRLSELDRAIDHAAERAAYLERYGASGVTRVHAGTSTRIYGMAVETFPHHINNVYLVEDDSAGSLLFDCGSGRASSQRDLALGFAIIRAAFEEDIELRAIDWCVVSHAHYDHFGGANIIKAETQAKLAVHELDARVLSCFDERIVVAAKDTEVFWRRAGVVDTERARLLDMYLAAKSAFRPQEVDRILRDGDSLGPGILVHHVPGHCPGLICLQVQGVLLTSDHVLSRTTPHQFPQAITPFAGLEHYFHSLAKVRKLDRIDLALGGHEDPIPGPDFPTRIDAIRLFHRDRLAKVLSLCEVPHTVLQVALDLFGEQEGYGRILALNEAGAHVEYLHQLGQLRIANLDDVARSRDPVIEYSRR